MPSHRKPPTPILSVIIAVGPVSMDMYLPPMAIVLLATALAAATARPRRRPANPRP